MSLEKKLQKDYGTTSRANNFYKRQVLDHLNNRMTDFIAHMDMMFISTADNSGNCDSSIRVGNPGFLKILDEKRIAYPEYRGNGVYARLGNIAENPHIGLLMVDFYRTTVGLHINGKAEIVEKIEKFEDPLAERWVLVEIEEAYIQCSKHIPLMERKDKKIVWNTDDEKLKGGDFFGITTKKNPPFKS